MYSPMGLSRPSLDEFAALFSRVRLKLRSFGTFKLLLLLTPFVDEAVLLDEVIPLSRVWLRLFWLVALDRAANLPLLPLPFVIKLLLFVAPIAELLCLLIDRIEPEEEHSIKSPPPE